MPDLSAMRRNARERHRSLQLSAIQDDSALDGAPLLSAEALLRAAENATGVIALPLAANDPLLAGAHAVLDRSTPCIWYAGGRDIRSSWQNFARAHEFGHYWLHPELEADACALEDGPSGFVNDPERNTGTQTEVGYSPAERRETEADTFASELLLPAPAVRKAFIEHGWKAGRIAAHVGVPESCALTQMASSLLLPLSEHVSESESNTTPLPASLSSPAKADPILLLDESQREAATIERGPVLIDAGPGTGKTRTLVARLAYLLHVRAVAPESILALTFSNLAAEEMRTRLRQTVGPIADRVWIGTFHAFGLELLRKDGHHIGLPHAPALLETPDAVALLQEHIDRLPLQEFEFLSFPILPFPDILQCISRAKDELKTPEDYLGLAEQEALLAGDDAKKSLASRKSREIAGIYMVYQQLLTERGLVDFGDLIMRAVELLDRCPEVRARWQGQYQHILADEYQDINRASAQLLRRLAGPGAGFWAVGDLRQAIYRFRGASPANVRDFSIDFPGGRRLQLRHNYRSLPNLVALFGAFAGQMEASAAAPAAWTAQRSDRTVPAVTLAVADDDQAQADGLAAAIQANCALGVPLREQAILCHTNRQAADLAARLEAKSVPTQYLGPLFEREEIKDLLSLLALACEPDGGALLRVARFPDYCITADDVQLLLRAARDQSVAFPHAIGLASQLSGITEDGRRGLARLAADLEPIMYQREAWKLLSGYLFETSEYLRPLLAESSLDATKRLLAIYQLLQTAQGLARRFNKDETNGKTAFLSYLRLMLACGQERSIRPPSEVSEIDGVRVMTIHQSKGLEFPIVYLPNLVEGQFPPRRGSQMAAPPAELLRGTEAMSDGDDEEEAGEECLFFVALSRARDQLILSRPAKIRNRAIKACRMLSLIEPFLREQSAEHVHWPRITGSCETVSAATQPTLPLRPAPTYSLSALEQYQRCPRQFYYQRIARLPQHDSDSVYLAFHLSLQQTLEWLQAERNASGTPDPETVQAHFNAVFDGYPASAASGTGRLLRRRAADLLRQAQSAVVQSHRPQARQALTAELEHGAVQMTCDQIEELPDGSVRLVDYTTRRPKDDDHTAPRLALLRHAAQQKHQQRPVKIVLANLHNGEQQEIEESKRYEPARVEKYNAALLAIRSEQFQAEPEPRKCALCPYVFICPA